MQTPTLLCFYISSQCDTKASLDGMFRSRMTGSRRMINTPTLTQMSKNTPDYLFLESLCHL